jgi:hypothetical protein
MQARGGQDFVQFASADYCVYFRDIFLDLVTEALYQASGYDEPFGFASSFLAGHFQNFVYRFLLRGANERAGVDYDDVGIFGIGGGLGSGLYQHAHHDLTIDEVLGAAEADKSDPSGSGWGGSGRRPRHGYGFFDGHWEIISG